MFPFDPLKTSENIWFSLVSGGSKGNIGKEKVKETKIKEKVNIKVLGTSMKFYYTFLLNYKYLNINANFFDSYGAGFIYTTALPPDKVFAAVKSLEILKSEEGQQLREKHQINVKRLRTKLVQHGFPVEHAPSHIVPVLVS